MVLHQLANPHRDNPLHSMRDLVIQIFLTIGITSVVFSLLLVVLYWWEDKQWRKKKEVLRQMYEPDVNLEDLRKDYETQKTTTKADS